MHPEVSYIIREGEGGGGGARESCPSMAGVLGVVYIIARCCILCRHRQYISTTTTFAAFTGNHRALQHFIFKWGHQFLWRAVCLDAMVGTVGRYCGNQFQEILPFWAQIMPRGNQWEKFSFSNGTVRLYLWVERTFFGRERVYKSIACN